MPLFWLCLQQQLQQQQLSKFRQFDKCCCCNWKNDDWIPRATAAAALCTKRVFI
jgi:hypothetical protein